MRLTNGNVQADFPDKSKIILNSVSKIVTYNSKSNEFFYYPISTAIQSDDLDMVKRLKVTKEIL